MNRKKSKNYQLLHISGNNRKNKFLLAALSLILLSVCGYFFLQKNNQANPNEKTFQSDFQYFPHHLLNFYSSHPEMSIVDTMVNRFLEQWEINGASLAIIKDGRLIYAKGFGFADKEKKIPVKPYHLFRIASVSKLFTAVAIMKLVEERKISLKDKVFGKKGILNDSMYFQAADKLVYAIEIEHLLTHTAGWRNQLRTDPMFVPLAVAEIMRVKSPPSLETNIQFMLAQKEMFVPGELYDYSNFGYCVLGKIIEKISGMSYQDYMQQKILQPLGIKRMSIGKNRYKDRQKDEVKYYTHKNAPQNLSIYDTGDSASRAYEGTNTEALGAAGGWIASSVDIARFLVAIDGFPHKKDILKKSSIEAMTTPPKDDSTGKRLIGWKSVDEEKWWRTGSLASTGISVSRRNDGISWVFITNTGSWRGPFFSYEIEGLMRRTVAKIKKYPEYDLFLLE